MNTYYDMDNPKGFKAWEDMTAYHAKHNHISANYADYSLDPEWIRLNHEMQKYYYDAPYPVPGATMA